MGAHQVPFGFTLRAIRENQKRAQAIGINVKGYQLAVFAASGFFTGLAGALLRHSAGAFVEFASIGRAFEPVFACILGGRMSSGGRSLGCCLARTGQYIGARTEHWQIFSGAILILLVLFLRRASSAACRPGWETAAQNDAHDVCRCSCRRRGRPHGGSEGEHDHAAANNGNTLLSKSFGRLQAVNG